ncbi:uncharacterized protein LOC132062982 [Lycium ferocissimum]|uniref:uncharacterized protein LOC132062982 n=1 Tax=Lycium ferocissimum TaxID=112874 RepID=UPI0028164EBE|nr:uncharacterized protein LOC132062982 [Lycium ferocissimum]
MQRNKDLFHPRRKMEDNILPLYFNHSSVSRNRRISLPSWLSGKWIHLIPIGILLSLFILWWFSYPVLLEIRDGRIKDIHKIIIDEVVPESLNENTAHIDLTILAIATTTVSAPAFSSIPQRQQVENGNAEVYNEIAAEPMSNYKFG